TMMQCTMRKEIYREPVFLNDAPHYCFLYQIEKTTLPGASLKHSTYTIKVGANDPAELNLCDAYIREFLANYLQKHFGKKISSVYVDDEIETNGQGNPVFRKYVCLDVSRSKQASI
ncbi:MAG TPA: hypothetical protein VFK27_06645, partial [Bacillales bacterium]|nr:hypothetical protein [Bacillales bacterium]